MSKILNSLKEESAKWWQTVLALLGIVVVIASTAITIQAIRLVKDKNCYLDKLDQILEQQFKSSNDVMSTISRLGHNAESVPCTASAVPIKTLVLSFSIAINNEGCFEEVANAINEATNNKFCNELKSCVQIMSGFGFKESAIIGSINNHLKQIEQAFEKNFIIRSDMLSVYYKQTSISPVLYLVNRIHKANESKNPKRIKEIIYESHDVVTYILKSTNPIVVRNMKEIIRTTNLWQNCRYNTSYILSNI